MEEDRLIELARDLRLLAGMMMEDLCPLAVSAPLDREQELLLAATLRGETQSIGTLLDACVILLEQADRGGS